MGLRGSLGFAAKEETPIRSQAFMRRCLATGHSRPESVQKWLTHLRCLEMGLAGYCNHAELTNTACLTHPAGRKKEKKERMRNSPGYSGIPSHTNKLKIQQVFLWLVVRHLEI